MLDETKKHFTPGQEPAKNVALSAPPCGIMCFSTSNFDGMKQFLEAMGFTVTEGKNQLLPLFSSGRGARVKRGDLDFNLE